MECTFCKNKEATCHLTKIVEGKVVEVHVCADCIPEINNENLVNFDIWDAVSKLAASLGVPDPSESIEPEAADEITAKSFLIDEVEEEPCPVCGFTGENLRKVGRLGCPDCFEHFNEMLTDVLADCQKYTQHSGKVPKSMVKVKVRYMQKALNEAVKEERFEDAAQIRDQLKTMAS
ncbi:MAG: UvrB/UvrC motif-containing protein [Verrucomicrobiota bacterium]